jgi:hypothetical protein
MSVQQLKVLLEFFPPEEGYLRIQLIQAVFTHIVDLENMDLIIDQVLTPDERNEVKRKSNSFLIVTLFLC